MRYRVIDKCLSDSRRDYTTSDILRMVRNSGYDVTLRMIQKDILAISEELGHKVERTDGRGGYVRYVDQSQPIFYQKLSDDEEEVLREALSTLGQFDGLDNFTWLDLLKKRLQFNVQEGKTPIISFSRNEGLQIPGKLLGRLFTAISRRKAIRIRYRSFVSPTKEYAIYPYQLKQFNERWFLLCTPLASEQYPYDKDFIATFPLDRLEEDFEYLDDEVYIECALNLQERYDQIVGVTVDNDREVEEIIFAVRPETVPYVKTKYIHQTQVHVDGDWESSLREKYANLPDCDFFSIECRPNEELFQRLASYGDKVILLEPAYMRDEMYRRMQTSFNYYRSLVEVNV